MHHEGGGSCDYPVWPIRAEPGGLLGPWNSQSLSVASASPDHDPRSSPETELITQTGASAYSEGGERLAMRNTRQFITRHSSGLSCCG